MGNIVPFWEKAYQECDAVAFPAEQIQPQMPVQEPVRQSLEKETQSKPKRLDKICIRNCGLPKRTLMLVVNGIVILYNTISKRRRDSEIIRKDYRTKKSK